MNSELQPDKKWYYPITPVISLSQSLVPGRALSGLHGGFFTDYCIKILGYDGFAFIYFY